MRGERGVFLVQAMVALLLLALVSTSLLELWLGRAAAQRKARAVSLDRYLAEAALAAAHGCLAPSAPAGCSLPALQACVGSALEGRAVVVSLEPTENVARCQVKVTLAPAQEGS